MLQGSEKKDYFAEIDKTSISDEQLAELILKNLKPVKKAKSYDIVFRDTKWDIVSWFKTDHDHPMRSVVNTKLVKGYILSKRSQPDVLIIVSLGAARKAYKLYKALDIYPSMGHEGKRVEGKTISNHTRPKDRTANTKRDTLRKPIKFPVKPFCLDALGADVNLFDDIIQQRVKAKRLMDEIYYDPFEVKPLYNTAIGREGREKRNRLAVKDVFEEIGKKYDSI